MNGRIEKVANSERYARCVQTSKRVRWDIEKDVIRGRRFDAADPLLTPGARNYWKSHDFMELSDAAIAILIDAVRKLPGPECEIFVAHVGGAAGRIAVDATAFPQRSSHFVVNVHARWREPKMDQACIG